MSLREQFDQWVKDRRPDKYPAEWEAFQAGHAQGQAEALVEVHDILEAAPYLPIEEATDEELTLWTRAISSVLMLIGASVTDERAAAIRAMKGEVK